MLNKNKMTCSGKAMPPCKGTFTSCQVGVITKVAPSQPALFVGVGAWVDD